MNFSIRKIMPHVYHLNFETQYEVAMHFLRFQEHYESPKFYKKFFTLPQYMEWYCQEHGEGAFSYPKDWSGFNVPSWVLLDVSRGPIPDPNEYDAFMACLINRVEREEEHHPFCFIGTYADGKKGDLKDVLAHEIAHALYFVNPKYRQEVNLLLEDPFPKSLSRAYDILMDMGYHHSTIEDEIHAYCATGLCEDLKGKIPRRVTKPFQDLFKEYQGKCARLK